MPRPSDPNVRPKLLAAAEHEFGVHGLDAAKVSDITARAGVSKGAFYLHFESKTALFKQLIEAFLLKLRSVTDQSVDAGVAAELSERQLLEGWRQCDLATFQVLVEHRALIRVLLEGGSGARFRYLLDELLDQTEQKSRSLLELGVRRGIYHPDLHIPAAATFLAGAYDRLARQIARSSGPASTWELDEQLGELRRYVLQGIASERLLATLRAHETNSPPPASTRRPSSAPPFEHPPLEAPPLEHPPVTVSASATSPRAALR